MNRVIYKFPFEIEDRFFLKMPRGAEVLHVEVQQGRPCLWALVDLDQPTEEARFRVLGTGHRVPADVELRHAGTFQDGEYVWHVFEELHGRGEV